MKLFRGLTFLGSLYAILQYIYIYAINWGSLFYIKNAILKNILILKRLVKLFE